MITSVPTQPVSLPSPQSPARNLDEALIHAETSALHLKKAHQTTEDGYRTLDGFQPSAVDISRDTPWRDVSGSGRELRRKSESTGNKAENVASSQYSALGTLDWAVSALDRALRELPPQMRQEALEARHYLDQRDEIQQADLDIGYTLAGIYGGAMPYIQTAELDSPGQDVSWTGGEIYGILNQSLSHLGHAGHVNGESLAEVNEAISILRELRDRLPAEVGPTTPS